MNRFSKDKLVLKRKTIIILIPFLITIGMFIDIFNLDIVKVDKNFINNIFIALVTLAALSASILTIVINSLDNRYHGFTIKEIINFDNDHIKIKHGIPVAILSILMAVPFLAFGFINTVMFILVSYDLFIISLNGYCWKIVSDNEFCEKILEINIRRVAENINEKEIKRILDKIFAGISSEIKECSIDTLIYEINFIKKILDLVKFDENEKYDEEIFNFIDSKIKKLFGEVTKNFGFLTSVDNILELYNYLDIDYKKYEPLVTILEEIYKIKYQDSKDTVASSINRISNGIDNYSFLDENDKKIILYQYFKNVYENENIGKKLRRKLLDDHIEHLTNLRNSNIYDYTKQKTLLNILKDYVILSEEDEESKHIFVKVVEGLFENRYINSKASVQTIALVYLSIYLFSEYEEETLNEDHRHKLKGYMDEYEDNINIQHVTFKRVLDNKFLEVIKELFNLNDKFFKETRRYMEYFSTTLNGKTITWSRSMALDFAIYNFFIIQHEIQFFKIVVSELEHENKKYVLESIIDMFIYNKATEKMKLEEKFSRRAESIAKWIGQRYFGAEDFQNRIFEFINEAKKQIDMIEISKLEKSGIESEKIKDYLKNKFASKDNYFGFDEGVLMGDSIEIALRPIIIEKIYYKTEKLIADKISSYIEKYLENLLLKKSQSIKIGFDQKSVNELLRALKNGNYDKRNYTYFDDLAISSDVRDSPNYIKLKTIINSMGMIKNTNPINSFMFFKENELKYNIDTLLIEKENLDQEDKLDLIERFKVSKDRYKINKTYYTESQAINIIQSSYYKIHVKFKIKLNLSSNSMLNISFKN